jgi:biopolymer transport protein ExbD
VTIKVGETIPKSCFTADVLKHEPAMCNASFPLLPLPLDRRQLLIGGASAGAGLLLSSPAGAQATQNQKPLQLSVDVKGRVFINDTQVPLNELIAKLKAITDARGGLDERIFVRADNKADYGTVARVMGLLSGAGFKRLALVTEVEQGT